MFNYMIQIFGTKKCRETGKATRYLKERNIPFQFIDLNEKGMSKGEIKSVASSVGIEILIDTECREYEKRGLKYMGFDIEEILLETPLLIKTPVLRNGNEAAVGYQEDVLKKWISKK